MVLSIRKQVLIHQANTSNQITKKHEQLANELLYTSKEQICSVRYSLATYF